MDKYRVAESFISDIRTEFPNIGDEIDQKMRDFGYTPEDNMYCYMFEWFSESTTDAITIGDLDTASRYLNYMSQRLENATTKEEEYIDVYYTESLMWDIKDEKIKSRGWKIFPKNLRKLYEEMWGEQDL